MGVGVGVGVQFRKDLCLTGGASDRTRACWWHSDCVARMDQSKAKSVTARAQHHNYAARKYGAILN